MAGDIAGFGNPGAGTGGYGDYDWGDPSTATAASLLLPPDQENYAVVFGNDVEATDLDGGVGRYRQDKLGASGSGTIQWTVNAKNYNYLMAFWRTTIAFGSLPCFISLYTDSSTVLPVLCFIVPGSFGLLSQQGQTFVVGCQIEILPDPTATANDATILAAGPDF